MIKYAASCWLQPRRARHEKTNEPFRTVSHLGVDIDVQFRRFVGGLAWKHDGTGRNRLTDGLSFHNSSALLHSLIPSVTRIGHYSVTRQLCNHVRALQQDDIFITRCHCCSVVEVKSFKIVSFPSKIKIVKNGQKSLITKVICSWDHSSRTSALGLTRDVTVTYNY